MAATARQLFDKLLAGQNGRCIASAMFRGLAANETVMRQLRPYGSGIAAMAIGTGSIAGSMRLVTGHATRRARDEGRASPARREREHYERRHQGWTKHQSTPRKKSPRTVNITIPPNAISVAIQIARCDG